MKRANRKKVKDAWVTLLPLLFVVVFAALWLTQSQQKPAENANTLRMLGGEIFARDSKVAIPNSTVEFGNGTVKTNGAGHFRIQTTRRKIRIKITANGFKPTVKRVTISDGYTDMDFSLDRKYSAFYPPAAQMPPVKPIVIHHGNRLKKQVALTIDDGWKSDDRILDLLEKNGIKVTVFVIGGRGIADRHPEWIRRMDRAGFEVATHTFDHEILTKLSDDGVALDVERGQRIISEITGKKYPYMRPSGGAYDDRVLQAVASRGYKMILWSIDLEDTRRSIGEDEMVKNVLGQVGNGDIILCHFGGRNTYEALSRIVPELLRRGYKITTVSEVIKGAK